MEILNISALLGMVGSTAEQITAEYRSDLCAVWRRGTFAANWLVHANLRVLSPILIAAVKRKAFRSKKEIKKSKRLSHAWPKNARFGETCNFIESLIGTYSWQTVRMSILLFIAVLSLVNITFNPKVSDKKFVSALQSVICSLDKHCVWNGNPKYIKPKSSVCSD